MTFEEEKVERAKIIISDEIPRPILNTVISEIIKWGRGFIPEKEIENTH